MKGEMMKRFFASLLATFALIGATQARAIPTMSTEEVKNILTAAHTDYIEDVKNLSRREPCDQRARLRLSRRLFETLEELKKHCPSIVEELVDMFYGKDLEFFIDKEDLKKCRVNLIINEFGLIEYEVCSGFDCLFMREI